MKISGLIGTVLIIAIVFYLWKSGLLSKVLPGTAGDALSPYSPAWDHKFPNGEGTMMAGFNANHVAQHIYFILYDRGSINKIFHPVETQTAHNEAWAYLLSLSDTQLRQVVGAYYKIIKKGEDGLSHAIENQSSAIFGAGILGGSRKMLLDRLRSLNA